MGSLHSLHDLSAERAPQRPHKMKYICIGQTVESILPKGMVRSAKARGSFIDSLLVRIHFIIAMIRTGLAPWQSEFLFPGSLTTTLLDTKAKVWAVVACGVARG